MRQAIRRQSRFASRCFQRLLTFVVLVRRITPDQADAWVVVTVPAYRHRYHPSAGRHYRSREVWRVVQARGRGRAAAKLHVQIVTCSR